MEESRKLPTSLCSALGFFIKIFENYKFHLVSVLFLFKRYVILQ